MIRPTAKTPNTTDTIVSVISHLGRFYPATAAFHFVSGGAEPRIESRGSPNANDYSPICKPWCRINPFVRSLLQFGEECTFQPASASNKQTDSAVGSFCRRRHLL